MGTGRITSASRKVCPGCNGLGGKHTRLDCAYLLEEWNRQRKRFNGLHRTRRKR